MPKPSVKSVARPVPPAAIAAAAMGLLAFAAEAQQMTGTALRQNIPGAVIHLDTPLGSVVPISYAPDGTIEGKAGAVAFYLGSEKDRGKWWIEGSAVCHQWNTWFDGKKKCLSVNLKPGNRVDWADQDGGTGTATVIAFGKAEPETPSKQIATLLPSPQPPALMPSAPAQPTARLGGEPAEPRQPPAAAKQPVKPMPPAATAQNAETPKREPPKPVASAIAPVPPAATGPTVTPRLSSAEVATAGAPVFRVVNVPQDDVLNVRRGPNPTSDVVSTIPPSAANVRVTGLCNGDWCPVQTGREAGWVHRYFIMPVGSTGTAAPATPPRTAAGPITYRVVGVPASDVLNIRRIADGESEVVATIPANGNRIRLTGYCRREWCPVAFGRTTGWVNRQYLTLEY